MKENITKNEKTFIGQLVTSGDNCIGLFEAVKFATEMYLLGEKPKHSDSHWFNFKCHFMKLIANYDINNYGPDRYTHNANYSFTLTSKIGEFFDECVCNDYEMIEAFTNGFIEANQKEFGKYDWENYRYDFGYDDYIFELAENISTALIESLGSKCNEFIWGTTDWNKAKSPSKKKNKNK